MICVPHALAGPLLTPASRDLPALTVPLALNCTPRALALPGRASLCPSGPSRTSDQTKGSLSGALILSH
jgi:hypothetical protein